MVALPARDAVLLPASVSARPDGLRPVRIWLGFLIVLVFAMVLVGGATRLTESGLSITEWKPVTGAVPPLSAAAWQADFELYRGSPQYELLNQGMSLAEFQTIYWWEWGHRQLGRFIGLVYLAGFLWFALRRAVSSWVAGALFAMGLLLGTQGLVGWIMVASGLQPGMTAVAPVKLTLHLTLASLFFASLVAAYVRLGGAAREGAPPGLRRMAWALVALAFVQIALGGLVAGHDAGLTYNTWPLMDGKFVPSGLTLLEPFWLNLVDNVTTIQFNHRIGAYLLGAGVLAYAAWVWGAPSAVRGRGVLLAGLVLAQLGLGIATLVHVVPIGLALAHQGLAMVLLLALVWNASVLRRDAASLAR
jgi:cytochrome c oxidase assembly protein subunit 15